MTAAFDLVDDPFGTPPPPRAGDLVDDRYQLLSELRRTRTAVVFEATHRFTGRHVAVKMVAPDASPMDAADLRARLTREARALASVDHPSVLTVLDGGTCAGGPFVVTELPGGCTLAQIVAERGALRVEDAVSVASAAAAALEAVHRAGIVHRAVSPQSLVVTRDRMGNERLVLSEFGIAQVDLPQSARITRIGAVVETPAYTAVEQLLAYGDIDVRADVYALGMTLYECLTGTAPFRGAYAEVLLDAVGAEVPQLLSLCPVAGAALAGVVHRAIDPDRTRRFQAMTDFRRALHDATPWASTQTRLLARSSESTAGW